MAIGFVTVGVADAQLAPPDPNRGRLFVQNLSANDVWINFGAAAVAGQCLHLVPNQPNLIQLDSTDLGGAIQLAIHGIASAAGSNVFYSLNPF